MLVRYKEVGDVHEMSVRELLDKEINACRSPEWTDYDETDWLEGFEEWCWNMEIIEGEGN